VYLRHTCVLLSAGNMSTVTVICLCVQCSADCCMKLPPCVTPAYLQTWRRTGYTKHHADNIRHAVLFCRAIIHTKDQQMQQMIHHCHKLQQSQTPQQQCHNTARHASHLLPLHIAWQSDKHATTLALPPVVSQPSQHHVNSTVRGCHWTTWHVRTMCC
jgi:hypothetical protein